MTHHTLDATMILTANAGSSSVRLATYRGTAKPLSRVASLHLHGTNPAALLAELVHREQLLAPSVIAHRVVHGGEHLVEPCLIDSRVETQITRLVPLAPLHCPAARRGLTLDVQVNRAPIGVVRSDTRIQARVVPVDEGALLVAAANSLMRNKEICDAVWNRHAAN